MSVNKKTQPVTLHDLELWGGQLALLIAEEGKKSRSAFQRQLTQESKNTQIEIKRVAEDATLIRAEVKQRISEESDKIRDYFDKSIEAWVENRAADLLGVSQDEIKLLQDKQVDHEHRIQEIEIKVL